MVLDVQLELVSDTLDVVPGDEGGVGCLVRDELAVVLLTPVLLPVHPHAPTLTELLHPPAPQLSLHLHLQVPGELPVVLRSVPRLLRLCSLATLDTTVDDVGGQTKPELQTSESGVSV